jgi:hypothetical protein
MSGVAEGEVLREGRRVLRKMAAPGALLSPSQGAGYGLMVPGRDGLRQRMCVEARIVDAFAKRGWITAGTEGKSFTLSEAGAFWVRRAFAEGDVFAAQHRLTRKAEVAGADGTIQSVTVNDGESPLSWLYRRRGSDGRTLITQLQYEAGERLRSDFTLAQLTPRMGVDFTAPVVAGRRGAKGQDIPEMVLAAKQRFSRALAAVGPGLSDILTDICCHLIGLEAAERQKGWPQRSAKVVLQIALDRLAAHYGMGVAVGTGRRMRAWQAPEEEPSLP